MAFKNRIVDAPLPENISTPRPIYYIMQTELFNSLTIHRKAAALSVNNFSWVIPGRIAGCAVPYFSRGDDDAEWLAGQGVNVLVSHVMPSGKPAEECARHGIEWVYYPIPDFDIPSDEVSYGELVGKIVAAMKEEKGVCVHCHAGIGRTGLTLVCAVGRYLSLPSDKAVAAVRAVRPLSVETGEQMDFIRRFLDDRQD